MLKLAVRMQQFLDRTEDRDRGATAVEYGLIVALIAGVIIAGVTLLGQQINTLFNTMSGAITNP
jgi:pilus assembly protein Flp/PilA